MSQEIAVSGNGTPPAGAGWDDGFEALLRPFLPFLPADEPLAEDAALRDLGLDSMGTVELLSVLESAYDVRFRDDAMDLANFASPGAVWRTLTRMTDPAA